MMQDFIDMDTNEKIRYISESSNTSGYSTMSQSVIHHMSPASSVLSSPAHSPATALQTEFSNLNLPPTSPPLHQYAQLSNAYQNYPNYNSNIMTGGNAVMIQNQFTNQPSRNQQQYNMTVQQKSSALEITDTKGNEKKYPAILRITEQPVEKFRFRYKSEMHGTHGSLNGQNSKRTPKTYPEVELCNYKGQAIIRCSLFQTNLESPHSHQLVVRRDETDVCDPHDLTVSLENGYIAMFQNMGIIHTAKKHIFEELLKKKTNRLIFEQGSDELSTKQKQELHKATEKEAKDMNLNQVRLCFEAFKIEEDKTWTRIAEPIYTTPINNRKSAQTGELRIVRLSIATGSVTGNDDLILLVEKVSKKNIKVRFYEENDDNEVVWEAFARFREVDVHHQYAISCQTPPYKDKEIDKPVEVYIELVRPSDDERSTPPVTFRYKPKDSVVSRKRRRTCSTATSSSNSGSSVNSLEVPKTVQDQQTDVKMTNLQSTNHAPTISEEFNKESFINNAFFNELLARNSTELAEICVPSLGLFDSDLSGKSAFFSREGYIEHDGVRNMSSKDIDAKMSIFRKMFDRTVATTKALNTKYNSLERIFKLNDELQNGEKLSPQREKEIANEIAIIYTKHAEKNEHGDSIIHDIIINDNAKCAIKLCHIINKFKQNELFNRILNTNSESGLHCACLYNRALYIRPLLGLGCDPNIQDKHGNTALHIAVREQYLNCVESFMNMENVNLDLTLRNDDGLTPLHLAITQPDINIVKKLLEYNGKASLVPNSKEGNTALHVAVRQQRLDIVELILNDTNIDKHAILNARNTAGHTALDLAKCLNTKTGKEIFSLVSPTNAEVEPGNLVIKEEDQSSSSADEDDGEESGINDTCVKEEYGFEEPKINEESLSDLLKNEKKYQKIVKLLNENNKWRQVAENCNMEKFVCLWESAEDLLGYIQKKDVDYKIFLKALDKVDRDALDVLLTPMT